MGREDIALTSSEEIVDSKSAMKCCLNVLDWSLVGRYDSASPSQATRTLAIAYTTVNFTCFQT